MKKAPGAVRLERYRAPSALQTGGVLARTAVCAVARLFVEVVQAVHIAAGKPGVRLRLGRGHPRLRRLLGGAQDRPAVAAPHDGVRRTVEEAGPVARLPLLADRLGLVVLQV